MPLAKDTDIVFGIFHSVLQVAYIREDDLFFIRHMFMDLVDIVVEKFSDGEGDISRASGDRFRQFTADVRQPEV